MIWSLQISMSPGVGTATLDGRKGTPAATTLDPAPVTLMPVTRLAGSRSGHSRTLCEASAQVRKNGLVMPANRVWRVPVLIWMRLTRPLSGPAVCSLT